MNQPIEINAFTLALISAGAALAGSFIGALASLVATLINATYEARRKHAELVMQVATNDYDKVFVTAQKLGVPVPPLSSYIVYYDGVLGLLEKGDHITLEALQKIHDRVITVDEFARLPNQKLKKGPEA